MLFMIFMACKAGPGVHLLCTWEVEEREWSDAAYGRQSSVQQTLIDMSAVTSDLSWPEAEFAPPAGMLQGLTLRATPRLDLPVRRWNYTGGDCVSHDLVPVDWEVVSDQGALQAVLYADRENNSSSVALLETGGVGYQAEGHGEELRLAPELLQRDPEALDWVLRLSGGDTNGGVVSLDSYGREAELDYSRSQLAGYWLPKEAL